MFRFCAGVLARIYFDTALLARLLRGRLTAVTLLSIIRSLFCCQLCFRNVWLVVLRGITALSSWDLLSSPSLQTHQKPLAADFACSVLPLHARSVDYLFIFLTNASSEMVLVEDTRWLFVCSSCQVNGAEIQVHHGLCKGLASLLGHVLVHPVPLFARWRVHDESPRKAGCQNARETRWTLYLCLFHSCLDGVCWLCSTKQNKNRWHSCRCSSDQTVKLVESLQLL